MRISVQDFLKQSESKTGRTSVKDFLSEQSRAKTEQSNVMGTQALSLVNQGRPFNDRLTPQDVSPLTPNLGNVAQRLAPKPVVPQSNEPMLVNPKTIQSSPVPTSKAMLQQVKDYKPYTGTETSTADKLAKALSEGVMNAVDTAALNIPSAVARRQGVNVPTDDSLAGKVGSLVGELAPIGAAYKVAGKATEGLADASKIVRNLARGGVAGTAYQTAKELADSTLDTRDNGNESPLTRAKNIGESAALFGVGDAALSGAASLIGKTAKRIIEKYRPAEKAEPIKALPEGKLDTRLKAAEQRGVNAPGTEPIVNEHTFGLPVATKETVQRTRNIKETMGDLAEINNEIKLMHDRYESAVNDQYKLLKNQMKNRGGVEPRRPLRDDDGNVVGYAKGYSKNPEWYQSFYAQYKKVPNNRELREIAKEHVDKGYVDFGTEIPPWKEQVGFDDTLNTLEGVRNTIRQGLREVDGGIGSNKITDASLKVTKEKAQPKPKSEPELVAKTKPVAENIQPKPVTEATEDLIQSKSPRVRDKVYDYANEAEKGAWERLKGKRNTLSSNPVDQYRDYGIILAAKMVKGTIKLADATEYLVKEFGEEIRPHAKAIYEHAKSFIKEAETKIKKFETDAEFEPKDTKEHLVSLTKKPQKSVSQVAERWYMENVNNLESMNRYDKLVQEVAGKKLTGNELAHTLALNSRGSDIISHDIISKNYITPNGKVAGEPLSSITKQIPKAKWESFNDYLVLRHAPSRMERGERVYSEDFGMTTDRIQKRVEQLEKENPKFKEISEELYKFNKKFTHDWLVKTGLITEDVWKSWQKENPNWVPNSRFFEEIETRTASQYSKGKSSFSTSGAPVKRYNEEGSSRKIITPLEQYIVNIDKTVKTAKKNEVMQVFAKNSERYGDDLRDLVELKNAESSKVKDLIGKINEEDGIENLLEGIDESFQSALNKPNYTKGNTVVAMVDGKPMEMNVKDINLLDAITKVEPEQAGWLLDTAGQVTRAFKVLTTGANPFFSIFRSLLYDVPQAYMYSKTKQNAFQFSADLVHALFSVATNGKLYRAYRATGGGHTSPVAADRNLLKQSIAKIKPFELDKSAKGLAKAAAYPMRRGFNALENLANVMEAGPRLTAFKQVAKGGTYKDRVEALFQAQDLTVNFKRYGNKGRQVDRIFPYYNAAIQGLDKMARATKDKPARLFLRGFMAITIPTLALNYVNRDNKSYKNLSNYTRDRYLLFPTGDDKNPYVKAVKPREMGYIFGSLPERFIRKYIDQDSDAFKDFASNIINVFAPPGVGEFVQGAVDRDLSKMFTSPLRGTIAGGLYDVATNETFTGAPIVPGYLEGVSPRYQSDANTSEIAKKLGDLVNMSPKQIDHLIKQYTGFVGEIALPLSTKTKGSTLEQLSSIVTRQTIADPVYSTDASRRFYELKEKFDTMYQDKRLTGETPKGYDDSTRKLLDKVAKDMGEVTTAIRELDKADIPKKEKEAKKRALTELRNEQARAAYDKVRGK